MFGDQNGSVSEQKRESLPLRLITHHFERSEIDLFEKVSFNVKSPHIHVPTGMLESQIAQWNGRDVVVVINASHPASAATLVEGLRHGGFNGGILVVFGSDKDAEASLNDYFEAGADEFLLKPLSEGILWILIRALLQRKRNVTFLEAAHGKLTENIGLLRHDLATPLSVLQMSIASLKKPDFDSEKLESLVARCERQVGKMLAILAKFQHARSEGNPLDSAA